MAKKLLLAGVGALLVSPALAQQGGTTFEFGVSTGVRLEDNWLMIAAPSDSSSQISTELTFSAASETRSQKIQFNTGLELHYTDIADSALSRGIADPFANVTYQLFGPGSEVTLGASVSVADRELDFSDSDGTAIDTGVNASYAFGSDALFGGSVSVSSDQTRFDDGATDDDDRTNKFSLNLRFDVSPGLSLSPFVSQTDYDVTTGATSYVDTRDIGVSASATLSEVAVLTASLSQTRIDDNGTVSDATTGDLTVTLQGQNGSNSFSGAVDASSTGTRTELGYSRSMDLPSGTFNFGVGTVQDSADGRTWTANLAYSQPTQRGTFSVAFDRSITTGSDATETLNTDFSTSYRMELSDTSSLTFDLSLGESQDTGSLADSDGSASVTYTQQVANDWSLNGGVSHRRSTEGAAATISSNAIFLNLERTWVSLR